MKNAIGKLIKERLLEVGISKSELARRINCSSQNIFDVFERESIDTEMLLKISVVLNCNFFQAYYHQVEKEIAGDNSKINLDKVSELNIELPVEENDSQKVEYLKKRIACLEELNALLKLKLDD
jgi:hypothetical protein